MSGDGRADKRGIRTFVVGTGGQAVYQPEQGDAAWRSRQTSAGSQAFDGRHHGFLELILAPDHYEWRFHAVGSGDRDKRGSTVTDSGSAVCA
jgi:hypothetical protein